MTRTFVARARVCLQQLVLGTTICWLTPDVLGGFSIDESWLVILYFTGPRDLLHRRAPNLALTDALLWPATLIVSAASALEVYTSGGSGAAGLDEGTVLRYSLNHQMQRADLAGGGGLADVANAGKTLLFYVEKALSLERNFCWPLESLELLESDVSQPVGSVKASSPPLYPSRPP